MTLRLRAYRKFQEKLVQKALLPRLMPHERVADFSQVRPPSEKDQQGRIWFHAASVGELESLWPVVEQWLDRGLHAIVTVFSESAINHVKRLAAESEGRKGRILYAGYSPWEGCWKSVLERVRPEAFVTAKYEAWPELWCSLAEEGVPLVVVGARYRKSFAVAKRVCAALGCGLPGMVLLPAQPSEVPALRELFPEARIEVTGDPRWDRVKARASRGNSRARQLIETHGSLQRPWGVLGSVWQEDLALWKDVLKEAEGSLWIVPHRIDSQHIEEIEQSLREAGISYTVSTDRTGSAQSAPLSAVLVNEMGFLSELYAEADWAWIGGGFGAGVHSTIEPAIQNIPLACGPAGIGKFPEIEELRATGQLQIIREAIELRQWLEQRKSASAAERKNWQKENHQRLGATERVLDQLTSLR